MHLALPGTYGDYISDDYYFTLTWHVAPAGKVMRVRQKLSDIICAYYHYYYYHYQTLTWHVLSAGKVVRLRQKLSDITGAVTGIFGRKTEKDPAVARLDALKVGLTSLILSMVLY